MSKQHPNQDFYKIGGSSQSDGSDRGENLEREKQEFSRVEKQSHPAVKKSAKRK